MSLISRIEKIEAAIAADPPVCDCERSSPSVRVVGEGRDCRGVCGACGGKLRDGWRTEIFWRTGELFMLGPGETIETFTADEIGKELS